MNHRCIFCSHVATEATRISETSLFESEHFVAWPSLGALVEGWLILVPKGHLLSLAELPAYLRPEFIDFRLEVETAVERFYGPVSSFEHGPSAPSSTAGCGIDHAHLHLVPTRADLLPFAQDLTPRDATWRSVSSIWEARSDIKTGRSYIYLQQPDAVQWISSAVSIPSQLMRRAIARSLGQPEHYDWQQNPEHAIVNATVRRFQQMSSLSR